MEQCEERLLEALRALARELPEAVVAHWDERVIAGLDSLEAAD
jgi:hypothetical protein